jgi:hypothetical protein
MYLSLKNNFSGKIFPILFAPKPFSLKGKLMKKIWLFTFPFLITACSTEEKAPPPVFVYNIK